MWHWVARGNIQQISFRAHAAPLGECNYYMYVVFICMYVYVCMYVCMYVCTYVMS